MLPLFCLCSDRTVWFPHPVPTLLPRGQKRGQKQSVECFRYLHYTAVIQSLTVAYCRHAQKDAWKDFNAIIVCLLCKHGGLLARSFLKSSRQGTHRAIRGKSISIGIPYVNGFLSTFSFFFLPNSLSLTLKLVHHSPSPFPFLLQPANYNPVYGCVLGFQM